MVVKLNGTTQLAAVDFWNGNAIAMVNVVGKAPEQKNVAHDGKYTAFSYGWGVSKHLPASGMVKFANQADQPHFLVIQRVKDSTTNAQVRKFINSGGQGNPPWALKASADIGRPVAREVPAVQLRPAGRQVPRGLLLAGLLHRDAARVHGHVEAGHAVLTQLDREGTRRPAGPLTRCPRIRAPARSAPGCAGRGSR